MLIDSLLSLIAPHRCMSCGANGKLLCITCSADSHKPIAVPSRCYRCFKLTQDYKTCKTCRKAGSSLYAVYVSAEYKKIVKDIVKAMKFKQQREAVGVITGQLAFPAFSSEEVVVVPVPTISIHRRQRGFDHALLIARSYARHNRLKYTKALKRKHNNIQQVGANRQKRQQQVRQAFFVTSSHYFKTKTVLLVDDVTTTGATLEEAARTLRKAGAKRVIAVVYAQKVLQQ